MLNPGDKAPDFRLQNQDGQSVALKDLLAKGPLMIAFYPGDFTPVCTRQLCAYQEAWDHFTQIGLNVVGISHNTPSEHQKFRAAYHFSFDLLSDPGSVTASAYGTRSLWLFGGLSRGLFILNAQGRAVYRHVEPTTLTYRKAFDLVKEVQTLRAEKKL